jgi:hypothetical protein
MQEPMPLSLSRGPSQWNEASFLPKGQSHDRNRMLIESHVNWIAAAGAVAGLKAAVRQQSVITYYGQFPLISVMPSVPQYQGSRWMQRDTLLPVIVTKVVCSYRDLLRADCVLGKLNSSKQFFNKSFHIFWIFMELVMNFQSWKVVVIDCNCLLKCT